METPFSSRLQIIEIIKKLPQEALPELASFLTYLQFKTEVNEEPTPEQGSDFLMSIVGLGEAEETESENIKEIY